MKLWYGNPSPYRKTGDSYINALKENMKTMAREDTEIELNWPKTGYSSCTYSWPETYNAVEAVKRYYEAWKKGYDGVIIGCTHDPGLIEARSILDIPVVGVLESALLIASTLGSNFSLICLHRTAASLITQKIKRYGFADKLASIRLINMVSAQAKELYAEPTKLKDLLSKVAKEIVREDQAEVIIPGCTILSTMLTHHKIYEIDKVPLVDPVWAAVKMAEVLVDLKKAYGVGVSRASIYATPAGWEKEIPIES